ncbi:MAG: glycosyltransferase [Rickettsiales bacterium]
MNKIDNAIYGLERKYPQYSLRLWLKRNSKICSFFIYSFFGIMLIFPDEFAIVLFYLLNGLYLITQIFKLILIIIGTLKQKVEDFKIDDSNLETYSIILPVYKENKVINSLVQSIKKLDYPKALLEVKIVVEEDDLLTLKAIEEVNLPDYFEVIKVPVSEPRSKPKACNYALQFLQGKYVVVYDAEDRPHPQQLKQVIAKFINSNQEVVCVQARLNFYNREESYLTKMFAIEYALLFDYILVGLKELNIPICLGGTSNHFIKEKLENLGGWDAFNVTEDAELGVRLFNEGYQVELISSVTLEEAPLEVGAWIVQRSRWIKGHTLTSLQYMFSSNKLKIKERIGLILFLCLPNLTYLLLSVYLLLWIFIDESSQIDLLWKFNLSLGIILSIGYGLFVSISKGWKNMMRASLLMCGYYLLLPIAGIRAFWQILEKPFYWDKTEHGVSKNYEE